MHSLLNDKTIQTALVVDDESTVRILAREALEQAGFQVTEAADGLQAIAALERTIPDLMLLDVLMPGVDGFGVCRHLHTLKGGEFCTVVMMTGLDDYDSIQQAYDSGANDFVVKPINWQVLGYRAKYIARASAAFKEINSSKARLKYAQHIARLGDWEWKVSDNSVTVSDTIPLLLAAEKNGHPTTLHKFLALIHPEDRDRIEAALMNAATSHTSFSDDAKIACPNADDMFVHIEAGAVVDRNNHLISICGTIQDITERKRVEDELYKKRCDMEQFLYTVSHDLRSPLVTVKTFLGYLEEDIAEADHERIRKDLEFIHTAADRMGILLSELLDMAQIGQVPLPNEEVSYRQLISEVLNSVAGQISSRHVQIVTDDSELTLYGNHQRLLQIWQNLLDNAVKYMGDQDMPSIEIGAMVLQGEVVFRICDNGIGIAPEYHEKIFGLFEQLSRSHGGVGMGLTMVRRIIDYFEGRIWVESLGEGKGSCFKFTLPRAVKLATSVGENQFETVNIGKQGSGASP